MSKLNIPVVLCVVSSLIALLFGRLFGPINFLPYNLQITLYLTFSFFTLTTICIQKKEAGFAKLCLIANIFCCIFTLIFSALLTIELNNKIPEILNKNNLTILIGTLREHDYYRYSYDTNNLATPRDQSHRALITAKTFDYIDLAINHNKNRIALSCDLSGLTRCTAKIKSIYKIKNFDRSNNIFSIKYKNISYNNNNRSLIYEMSSNNIHLNEEYFQNHYRKEVYINLIWCFFLIALSLIEVLTIFNTLKEIDCEHKYRQRFGQ